MMKTGEQVTAFGQTYCLVRLLGRGKGGYSWLAESEGKPVVLKQIHHEPCDYYTFGDKMEAECRDYERLKEAGIRIPEMIAADRETERIVKVYIEGETIFDLVKSGRSAETYLGQIREMAALARTAGLNIDYFPTNFVIHDGLIWYIDYECNEYSEQWNFENWGIRYWSRTPEFDAYLKEQAGKDEAGKETQRYMERLEFSFVKTGTDSPDAQRLLKELNEILTGILGHDGTAHVCFDDFNDEKAFFLVGYDKNEPVCCAGVRRMDEETGEVKRVYARKNRKGTGTRLMTAVEKEAKEAGYRRLVLECREGNPHAIEFYRRNGYTACAKYPPYEREDDAVCLEKRLS